MLYLCYIYVFMLIGIILLLRYGIIGKSGFPQGEPGFRRLETEPLSPTIVEGATTFCR
jgi:hypothetical protein